MSFAEGLVSKTLELFGVGGKKKKPKEPKVPTIDQARENQIESDRLRRRRGSLGNVFGGATAQTPVTSAKTLLGA